MEIEESIRLAVIAGASHALNLRKADKGAFTEDLIQRTASNMRNILRELGEKSSVANGQLLSLAAITGASQALHFSDYNPRKSDREVIQHVTKEMETIVSNMDLKEK